MTPRIYALSLLLASLTSGAFAQESPKDAGPVATRPLNLSLRKPIAPAEDSVLLLSDQQVKAAVRAQSGSAGNAGNTGNRGGDAANPVMPYGAGFEVRQPGRASGGGAGGGGQGGSGRGR